MARPILTQNNAKLQNRKLKETIWPVTDFPNKKIAWLQKHLPELLEVSEHHTLQVLYVGNEIGEIARKLCQNGILIENNVNLSAALAATKIALAAHPNRPIFETTMAMVRQAWFFEGHKVTKAKCNGTK